MFFFRITLTCNSKMKISDVEKILNWSELFRDFHNVEINLKIKFWFYELAFHDEYIIYDVIIYDVAYIIHDPDRFVNREPRC